MCENKCTCQKEQVKCKEAFQRCIKVFTPSLLSECKLLYLLTITREDVFNFFRILREKRYNIFYYEIGSAGINIVIDGEELDLDWYDNNGDFNITGVSVGLYDPNESDENEAAEEVTRRKKKQEQKEKYFENMHRNS